ncbi:putative secreted protein (Por secretion system target) [Flavobacteriaceae bacterium MAR_2010_105]|nr:putative secreted protein (Por secretion system target) [Flavobacteriaceae bacterium MAR_2010_105]
MKKIIFFLAFVSIVFNPIHLSAQSDHPDYAALEALYNATNGDWWWDNTNWLTEEPVSTWYGITVDENNRVSEINLDVGLSGSIPDEIGDFEMLKILNLNWNWDLAGSIPATITNLIHLEELNLTGNNLSSDIPDLTSLNLNLLSIEGNKFQFGDFEDEFSTYQTNIPNLYYGFQHGEFIETIGQIGTIVELITDISGSRNNYSWYKLNEFHVQIPLGDTNSILTFPNFQNEDSGTYFCKATSDLVPGLEITWTFDCFPPSQNSPDYDALIAFYHATGGPDWFDNHNWLNPDVPLNKWNGIDIDGNNRVRALSLTENNLTGSLPPEIGDLENVEWFFFGRNSLTGEIPDQLWSLPNLEGIMLFYNQLTGTLTPAIENAKNLFALSLVRNNMTGSIPVEIGALPNLEVLALASNNLSGSIPSELGNLSNLYVLQLWGNNLSGNLPPELGNLSNLGRLYISNNKFTGAIPDTFGNLTNLEELELFDNKLSGSIPKELGNLTNLSSLLLGQNNLEGEIPPELGNLSNLKKLYLSYGNLTGEIPPELGNLNNLEDFLYISNNNLTGEIPSELGNLNKLINLNFQNNNIGGNIPDEIGNLTNLEQMGIANNQLEGEIPVSILNLKKATLLSFANNLLSGSVPDFSTLPNLEVLSIRQNNFVFSDFEDQFNDLHNRMGDNFYISPMNPFDEYETINKVSPPKVDVPLTSLFENNPNASANNSYQWYKNYEPIDGATNPNYLIEKAIENDTGEYTCMVTNSVVTGLTLERNPYSVNIIDKIPNPTDVVFTMYPNPTNSTFTINSDTVSEGIIQVYDFQGVLAFEDYYSSEYNNLFDASGLKFGIHIVKLSTFDGQVHYNKLIKK